MDSERKQTFIWGFAMRRWVAAAATVLSVILLAGCGSSGTTATVTSSTASVAGSADVSEVATDATEAATVETSEAAPSSDGTLAVGASAEFEWSGGATGTATVLGFERKTEPGATFIGPPKNGYYLIVDVAITSNDGQVSANPLYWEVKDPDGRAYNAALGAGGYEPQLQSGDVPTGRTTRGLVAFDVPAGPMTLQLAPPIGSPLASWAIPDGPGGPAAAELSAAGGTDQALAIGATAGFSWGSQGKGTATVYTAEDKSEANETFIGPPKNGRYVLLDVGVTATEGTISANPLYWKAVDAQGHSYGAELGSAGYAPQLDSGDLPTGSTSRGYVAFDAPVGPLTVDLTDPLGGVLASWSVPG